MNLKRHAAWLVCGLFLLGCGEGPKPAVDIPVAKAPALEASNESKPRSTDSKPRDVTVAGVKYTVPADWEEQPRKSDYVLGEFSIPGPGGPARLTLSSAGGGIEANVERWRGQFNRGPKDPAPKESEITFDGKPGTLVELAGTYSDMFGGGSPSKGWQMLGVAAPLGPKDYFVKLADPVSTVPQRRDEFLFVKLTGPAATVTPRRDEFLKFVESAKMEK